MERRYKPGEFAQKINRSIGTLRLWDRKGDLPAKRLPSGHRYYTEEDVCRALNIEKPPTNTKTVIYTRVSSPKQKEDLKRPSLCSGTILFSKRLYYRSDYRRNWGRLELYSS
jgi:hypothetical protein